MGAHAPVQTIPFILRSGLQRYLLCRRQQATITFLLLTLSIWYILPRASAGYRICNMSVPIDRNMPKKPDDFAEIASSHEPSFADEQMFWANTDSWPLTVPELPSAPNSFEGPASQNTSPP